MLCAHLAAVGKEVPELSKRKCKGAIVLKYLLLEIHNSLTNI